MGGSGTQEGEVMAGVDGEKEALNVGQAALGNSEARFPQIFDAVSVPLGVFDAEGGLVSLNRCFVQTFGYTPDDVPTLTTWWESACPDPGYRRQVLAKWEQVLVGPSDEKSPVEPLECQVISKSGELRDVKISATVLGAVFLISFLDVTEKKRAEAEIGRRNQLYAFVSQVNQMLFYSRKPGSIFAEVCRIAVEHGKFRMAWIGLIDENERAVKPAAWAGVEEGYLTRIKKISTQDVPEGRGPTGAAIREGRHFCCNDIAKDPRMEPWREQALQRGYRSSIALPLIVRGKVLGAFSLYAPERFCFGDTETRLLDEVAGNISYALETLDNEARRVRAEEGLAQQEYLLRRVLATLPVGVWVTDEKGVILTGNEVGQRIWSGARYVGLEHYGEYKGWWAATGQRIKPDEWAAARAITKGETSLDEEIDIECFDGTRKTILNSAVPLRSGDGGIMGAIIVNQDITERKRIELALAQRERELRDAQRIGGVGSWTYDPSGRISWSDETYRIYGVSPETFRPDASTFVNLLHPEDRPAMQSWINDCTEGKDPGELEFRAILPDGAVRYISGRGELVRDGAGNPPYMVGTAQDITQRKRAEEQAVLAAREWQITFDALQDAIWMLDRDFRIIRCNKATEKLLNKPSAVLVGAECWRIFHGTAEPPIRCLAQRIRASRQRETTEDHIGDRWYAASADPILDEDGNLHGVVHVVSDITERKQAEADRERLMTAIEQAAEAIIMTDSAGIIQYVNPAFASITGYSREEALGQNPRILKSGAQGAAFYRELWAAISSGHIWEGCMLNKRKDQSSYTQEMTISPVYGTSGEIVNYVAVSRDITRHLELEQQVRQSQKMDAVGQLAGGVAHDFNNILQGMMGYGNLLLEHLPNHETFYEYAAEIVRGTERAAALTRQLLMFSRRQVLQPVNLNLNTVIEDLLKMLRRIIGEDIRLEWIPGNRLGAVHADAGMMEQVVMNLCVNARDAMPRGGMLIIETQNILIDSEYCANHVWAKPGRFVLLSVTDTGCGMDKLTMERIFEPFFTTKELGKGTGLGLATVYGIVKQHKGMVNVYSEPGQGSTFKVYLPLCERAAVAIGPMVEGPAAGGNETILLAEDDEMVRELAVQVLSRAGYTVLVAKDGAEAVALFRQNADRIALLFLDVVMPNLGGNEAFESIRAIRPDIPALFSSGYSENAVHTNFVLHEGFKLIQKPYAPTALLRKIREVLGAPPSKRR